MVQELLSPVGFGAVAQGEGGAGWVVLSAWQSSSSGHAMAPLGLPLARADTSLTKNSAAESAGS